MTGTTLGPVRSWRQRRTVRSETRSISARSSSVRSWSSAGRVVVGIWSPGILNAPRAGAAPADIGRTHVTAPPRLTRIIRFALSDLSSQSAHHEFEQLCRHIAKRRIASNVIPATGPVAAGGDQGRDFETFRTYLRERLPFAIGFLALAAEDTIAFACTLQENDLPSKIRADIKLVI
jgi:hypothetical protein